MKHAVFMGSDSFSLPILTALIERGETLSVPVAVAAVVTQPDRPSGRGRKSEPGVVKLAAERAGVAVLQPERVRSPGSVADIMNLRPDIIVVASYGQILPRTLLEGPPSRALNLHPSLLPKYRGSSPIAAPILAGDSTTGTTLMLMSPRMDAGSILDQRTVEIGPRETAGELGMRLAAESADLLVSDLPAWLEGRMEPRPQDEDDATYTERVTKADGKVDWRLPAEQIARAARAYNPWPGVYTFWRGRQLKILESSAVPGSLSPGRGERAPGGGLMVGTGMGVLEIYRVQLAGSRPMTAAELLRGHPDIAGSVLGA